jgi:broad specificity phosphatase PhoE
MVGRAGSRSARAKSCSCLRTFGIRQVQNIVNDLPPLFEHFYSSRVLRTCRRCAQVHAGKS